MTTTADSNGRSVTCRVCADPAEGGPHCGSCRLAMEDYQQALREESAEQARFDALVAAADPADNPAYLAGFLAGIRLVLEHQAAALESKGESMRARSSSEVVRTGGGG